MPYGPTAPSRNSFWTRYLDVFDELRLIARVRDVAEVSPCARRLDGERVTVTAVPFFAGPWQFALRGSAVRRVIQETLQPTDAIILRVPSTVSTCLEGVARAQQQPYAVEVVGDPYNTFAPGGVRSTLATGYALVVSTPTATPVRWGLRRGVWSPPRRCNGVTPPAADAYVASYSSIDLRDEAFVNEPRSVRPATEPQKLIFVGSLAQVHKAADVLINAVADSITDGLDLHLTLVGDGQYRAELEQLARDRGIAARTLFAGQLPAGEAVRAELDQADLFILPSRTEGLPRVLIEAMARGLPCVSTAVGGIPELLPPEDLVPVGSTPALAARIAEVIKDGPRRARMAARNLAKARSYHVDILAARRSAFYAALRDRTAQWQHRTTAISR